VEEGVEGGEGVARTGVDGDFTLVRAVEIFEFDVIPINFSI
jgi:hypothetical protein